MATIFELIDLRSFSNLWFWIALAVVWSSASHFVMGVPFDMVMRAHRKGGQVEADLRELVRINAGRMLYIADNAGVIVVGVLSFVLTVLGILGFFYWVEFCQALLLIGFPMSLVWLLSVRTARRIAGQELTMAQIYSRLRGLRLAIQAIGMLAVLVTAFWGMYVNASLGVLGG
ncbi:component of SufBCD complex [Pseudooceanicola antarcticus]|nr:component of SufBCD complex [Pseudooceanicola antarcticus]PJE25852.1 component of SufBCD complex [Pseudooceanicola antarcticus]